MRFRTVSTHFGTRRGSGALRRGCLAGVALRRFCGGLPLLDIRTVFRQEVVTLEAFVRLLNVLRVSEGSVFRNAQIKRFPDGSAVVTVFDRCIIRAPGFEAVEAERRALEDLEGAGNAPDPQEKKSDNLARSQRRARAAIYDIVKATDFEYFATFTIDPAKVHDRMDDEEVFRHLWYWLDNNVRRRGLAYVLVPEYHKKGGLHFHALINDALAVEDSGCLSIPGCKRPRKPRSKAQRRALIDAGAQPVYNLPGWPFGFTTAIRLYGDRDAAIGYVCKYVSKSDAKIGGRWYYSGGELKRPRVDIVNLDFDQAAQLGVVWDVEELGAKGVRLKLKGDDFNETLERLCGAAPAAGVAAPESLGDAGGGGG